MSGGPVPRHGLSRWLVALGRLGVDDPVGRPDGAEPADKTQLVLERELLTAGEDEVPLAPRVGDRCAQSLRLLGSQVDIQHLDTDGGGQRPCSYHPNQSILDGRCSEPIDAPTGGHRGLRAQVCASSCS